MATVALSPSNLDEKRTRPVSPSPQVLGSSPSIYPLLKRERTHTRITHAMRPTTQSHPDNMIFQFPHQLIARYDDFFGEGFYLLELLSCWPFTTHSETRVEVG